MHALEATPLTDAYPLEATSPWLGAGYDSDRWPLAPDACPGLESIARLTLSRLHAPPDLGIMGRAVTLGKGDEGFGLWVVSATGAFWSLSDCSDTDDPHFQ